VRSQVEDYRAKAKECARLTVVTKSLREGRRYRKLAEMYWALALGEEIKHDGFRVRRRPKQRPV